MTRPYTAYVTARTMRKRFTDPAEREEAAALMRRSRVSRVVLEGYRGGLVVDEPLLAEVRDYFEAQGFSTLGGLMPVYGEGFGTRALGLETRLDLFCYSSRDTLEALEREVRKLARLFEQVVVDDAFSTSCRCRTCRTARNGRDWGEFRRELMCNAARQLAAAAHEERPSCLTTVKFPQYYDRYQEFGYDAVEFPKIFDRVWTGTETRNPEDLAFGYTEQYQGYFNAQWMRACAGDRFEGAWFDSIDCNEQLFYEQGVTTHLAAPGEITLFRYSPKLFRGSRMARLIEAGPRLDALTQAARSPRGVHVVKPPNSAGGHDLFLFDYLGMLGIPCLPAVQLDPSMTCAILTAHVADDPGAPEAAARIVEGGGQVIATYGALWRMAECEPFLRIFGYTPEGVGPFGASVLSFDFDEETFAAKRPYRLPGDLAPEEAAVLAWASIDSPFKEVQRVPFVTCREHTGGGRALVWNLGSFDTSAFVIPEPLNVPVRPCLLNLPTQVIKFLRDMATARLGIQIDAPARVAAFLFAEHLVFVNYSMSATDIEVRGLDWDPESLESDSPNTVCSEITLLLAPRSHAVLRIRQPGT